MANRLRDSSIEPQRRALWLRGRFEQSLCQAALELLQAREKASGRYPNAERMYFTKPSLEQATDVLLAQYHASLFPQDAVVLDAGCGSGIDTVALAARGCQVLGVDIDPVHCVYTRLNSELCQVDDRVTVARADLLKWPVQRCHWLYADPMRRNDQGRQLVPDQWIPPLSYYLNAGVPNGVVKASPMLKPDNRILDGRQITYLEHDGECKEAMISWGECALHIGQAVAAHAASGTELRSSSARCDEMKRMGSYLVDPSASVLAADLLPQLAHQLQAWRISWHCGYLSSDAAIQSPFARTYRVIDLFQYQKTTMKRYLIQHSITQVILKKRGLPAEWGSEWVKPDTGGRCIGLFAAFPVKNRHDVWLARLSLEAAPSVASCCATGTDMDV